MTKIGFRIRSSEKYASIYVYFHNSENQKIERKTGFYTRSEFWSVYSQRSCCPTTSKEPVRKSLLSTSVVKISFGFALISSTILSQDEAINIPIIKNDFTINFFIFLII